MNKSGGKLGKHLFPTKGWVMEAILDPRVQQVVGDQIFDSLRDPYLAFSAAVYVVLRNPSREENHEQAR